MKRDRTIAVIAGEPSGDVINMVIGSPEFGREYTIQGASPTLITRGHEPMGDQFYICPQTMIEYPEMKADVERSGLAPVKNWGELDKQIKGRENWKAWKDSRVSAINAKKNRVLKKSPQEAAAEQFAKINADNMASVLKALEVMAGKK